MTGLESMVAAITTSLVPILVAAMGGLATEYVGVLNIALEGLILAGGFSYIVIGSIFGPVAGAFAALAIPGLLSYGQDLFARKARADAFVVGLSLNLLVPGLASVLSQAIFGTKGVFSAAGLAAPRLFVSATTIPVLGAALFGHRWSDYLGLGVACLIAVLLGSTPFGLRARAAGMNPDSLKIAGVRPGAVRGAAYLVSGLACGAAGAALAAAIGAWVPNLSAGRGWIALVAVYMGGKRPGGTFLASVTFAFLLALANRAQTLPGLPAELLSALPYLATALVVIVGSALKKRA
ncbi:MAG: ABC transporter permease [Spirochaetales bacterium]|nr:MAG: ABC transporter permease [Spirochaetales bacterium]